MHEGTWHEAPVVPHELSHLRDVLLVSGSGQREDDLHHVSVHQAAVSTLSHLNGLEGD